MKRYGKKRIIALLLTAAIFLSAMPSWEAWAASGRWKVKKSGKYYVKPNGKLATKSYKIKGKYYVFSLKGKLLLPKKNSLMDVGNKTYYVSKKGTALTGWHIIRGKLYNMEKTGAVRKNKKYQGIELTDTGAAKNSRETKIKFETVKTVAKVTDDKMTKKQKLYACWKYISSKKKFQYVSKYPDLKKKGWQKETAYDMLKTKKGNCYSFACAFAAMANELGYESYVITGRIKGSRDNTPDGFTRHAWVKIDGRYYDPEGCFAGWRTKIYGLKKYPLRTKEKKTIRY